MNVIRHHDKRMHLKSPAILEQTMIEDRGSGLFRENKPPACAEAHKVAGAILLHVRQVSAVEDRHAQTRFIWEQVGSHKDPGSAAAPGCV